MRNLESSQLNSKAQKIVFIRIRQQPAYFKGLNQMCYLIQNNISNISNI